MSSSSLSLEAYVFPMAYCNGELHIGHLYVLNTLYAIYNCSNNKNKKLIFPYHLSGLPAVLFFENYLKKDIKTVKIVNEFSDKTLLHIEDWFNCVKTHNNRLLKQLEYPINFEHSHFTTSIEYNYDQMVKFILSYCKTKDLIYKGNYNTVYCINCNNTVGDHELDEPTHINLTRLTGYESSNNLFINEGCIWFSNLINKYVTCDEKIYDSIKLVYKLEKRHVELIDSNYVEKSIEIPLLVKSSKCRCGEKVTIKNEFQTFIDYSNQHWKNQTIKLVYNSNLDLNVQNQIIQSIKSLRGWPMLRSRGIGTIYEDRYVDGLTDSVLFQVYSIIHPLILEEKTDYSFWHSLFLNTPSKIDKWNEIIADFKLKTGEFSILEVTGKDLLPNHITFSYFFYALFNLQLKVHGVGHIMLNLEKMSKSKGNVLTIRELSNTYSPPVIKYILLTSAQNLEDGNITLEGLQLRKKELQRINKQMDISPISFNEYSEYIIVKLIHRLHSYLSKYAFRSFYNLVIKGIFDTKDLMYINIETHNYLKKLIYLPIDHHISLGNIPILKNQALYSKFEKFKINLDKDIKKWFLNKQNQHLIILLSKNNEYVLQMGLETIKQIFKRENLQFLLVDEYLSKPKFLRNI